MLDNKEKYIKELLVDLNELISRISEIEKNHSLPFSFFNVAFDKLQQVSKTLHDLEILQIQEMKGEMKKLVNYLSNIDISSKIEEPESIDKTIEQEKRKETEVLIKDQIETVVPEAVISEEKIVETTPVKEKSSFLRAEKLPLDLPTYKNPFINANKSTADSSIATVKLMDKVSTKSLNDNIETKTAIIDFKKQMSLNDLFLIQRELFDNDREKMNNQMSHLGSLDSYEECKQYMKKNFDWDFESPIVQNFMDIVQNGFIN